jgi:hypothetical protein
LQKERKKYGVIWGTRNLEEFRAAGESRSIEKQVGTRLEKKQQ